MAQLANEDETTTVVQEPLSVDANDQTVSTEEETPLSPVYKRPKDDPSISPNAIQLADEQITEIFVQFGHSPQEIKDAMATMGDKRDVFALKKYFDDRRDPMAKLKEWVVKAGFNKMEDDDDQKEVDPVESKEDETKEVEADNMAENKFPVHVFVRMRPLIESEIENNDTPIVSETKFIAKTKSTTLRIEDCSARNVRKSAIKRPGKSGKGKGGKGKEQKKKMKTFKGFGGVLSEDIDNRDTFKQCILPSLDNLWNGHTVCSFAYGHTGSGKTYTIMGYDKDESPGLYRLTAAFIESEVKKLNATIADDADKVLLSCRFAELYQGKMRDLFGNLVECHVRESDDGRIVIRGPTIKEEATGQVKVAPLTPVEVREGELNKFLERVTASLALRKQGSSATHDESSRSHVFLEMELVTKRLIEARTALWNAEAEIVPIGKALTDHKINNSPFMTKAATYNHETQKMTINEEWKEEEGVKEKEFELTNEYLRLSVKIIGCQQRVETAMKRSDCCVGGKVVFVDLAGNEWGSDSKNVRNDNTVQMKERQEINKSLLALKECVRAMNLKKDHVPFRDSKLTMVLRPHLKANNSTAIMIANISPSDQHIKKTFNTLSYSALVAKA